LSANGLGYSAVVATVRANEIEALFAFLPDIPEIYTHWTQLVDNHAVCGKQVHDARLLAVMLAHGVTHLLTLNSADFLRFTEITVVGA
jgi:predicted nucleic acid-binding protein